MMICRPILYSNIKPDWKSVGLEHTGALKLVYLHNANSAICISVAFQASGLNNLIADEYFKDAKTPEDIRDGFTEMLGDLFMVLPVIKVAGYHRG